MNDSEYVGTKDIANTIATCTESGDNSKGEPMSKGALSYNGKAVIYARVSTDDKDQDPMTQVRNITKWCEDNNIEIVGTYVEEKSGKNTDRPQLRACLGHIALERITYLVAWHQTRLSRDTNDMTHILKVCSDNGTAIRYVSSDTKPETDEGELINYVATWQGKSERMKLAMNTKAGMESAKLKGVHCGRMLAFCFTHRVAENKAMIQSRDDAKQKTVIMSLNDLMDMARQGLTTYYVAKNILHIAPSTLVKALKHEGKLEEYRSICSEARGQCKQGVTPTRVEDAPENLSIRGEY